MTDVRRRRVIIHCDDIGLSYESNQAGRDLLMKGIARSASVMIPCPWAFDFINWAKEHPDLDIGIHITLTSEWKTYRWRPISGDIAFDGGLVDEFGFMHRDVAGVVNNASAEAVEAEIRAQVRQALDWGLQPTHLDTHMGTVFARTDFLRAYIRVGEEFGVSTMLVNPTKKMLEAARASGHNLDQDLTRVLLESDNPKLDWITGAATGSTYDEKKSAVYKQLSGLPQGLSQFIIHPAPASPAMQRIAGSWQQRDWEYRLFLEDETLAVLNENGIETTTWREVAIHHSP